ncbi:alkene reductase [Pseudonocardia hydrocarbonoxydans]|uniref:Alkene reductase n=1 Tax=Pseudonocardia hydrocarbonoxydans TaxID=76726 RepID=A0A4Y3WQG7_9PSEU|nr:alkene reductase [Pseudonocardia hydrocarbonoxydans]GEC20748.1 alkene reductase [Pseudonocardia hydrocarbonoxydans]
MTQKPLPSDSPILQPVTAGALEAKNRLWMAPLTRNRADADGTPNDLSVEYYRQRAEAGVIVSEGSQPSAVGQGYPHTAGAVTDANEAGWTRVAEAVHADGGLLVVQLMHAGRISHTSTIAGETPVSSTATQAAGQIFTLDGQQDHTPPRALGTDELPGVAAEFADAARRVVRAGADGVELHAANGYLLHQFLADGVNDRTDSYGGSPENRARFVVEVAKATAAAIGADRVGIRLSPGHPFNDITEDDLSVYETLVAQLADLGLAYVHLLAEADDPIVGKLRAVWPGTFVLNTGFGVDDTRDDIARLLADGVADAVAVGRPFLANPDLVTRWAQGADLNEPNQETFYGGGAEGYTDYPRLAG